MDELDCLKIRSSLTLFSIIDNKNDLYEKILDKYFDGQKDQRTIDIINNNFKKHN